MHQTLIRGESEFSEKGETAPLECLLWKGSPRELDNVGNFHRLNRNVAIVRAMITRVILCSTTGPAERKTQTCQKGSCFPQSKIQSHLQVPRPFLISSLTLPMPYLTILALSLLLSPATLVPLLLLRNSRHTPSPGVLHCLPLLLGIPPLHHILLAHLLHTSRCAEGLL